MLISHAVSQDVPHIGTNKTVHYDNERAAFECVLNRPNLVIWYLNGVSPPNEPADFMATISTSYTSDKVMSNLTMDASPETNNTRIVCQAYVGRLGVVYNSAAVVLSVQGKQQCFKCAIMYILRCVKSSRSYTCQ